MDVVVRGAGNAAGLEDAVAKEEIHAMEPGPPHSTARAADDGLGRWIR